MRRFLLIKYGLEWLVIVTVFTCIIFAAIKCIIDKNTAGALLGVAVGYSLKGFRKLHK